MEDELYNLFIMGKDKKRKKPTQEDTSDAEISDNGDNITNDITTQHFPRFLLIESMEENQNITSLSPFVIQKVILGIAGEPDNIKKLYRSNQLLVEISKKSHAENLLRTTLFHNLKVRVFPHASLNSSKGVIRCPDLRNSSEILEGTRSQGVTAVKRFKIKRNCQLKDTNTFVFTFNTPTLPKTVKVAYFRVNVEIYIPNPLRCHNCQKYGHHENRCTKDPICANCGEPANHTEQSCTKEPNCVNCGGKHSANSKECQVWHKEKEILTVKFTRNLSFPEARKSLSPLPQFLESAMPALHNHL